MYFDNSSNAIRKRKLAAKIQKSVASERAGYRAERKAAEAAKRAKQNQTFLRALPRVVSAPALQAPNLTPEDITALREFAEQCREQHCKGAA